MPGLTSSGATTASPLLPTAPAFQTQVSTWMPFSSRTSERRLPISASFQACAASWLRIIAGISVMLKSGTRPEA